MTKKETLSRWHAQEAGQDPLSSMTPIPYKARGSTYGACGIRIDGNPAFVDAVLSNLRTLLAGENNVTRLGLSRNPVNGKAFGKGFGNRDGAEAEVCYIRLHVRGRESEHTIFNMHPQATADFAKALGVTG